MVIFLQSGSGCQQWLCHASVPLAGIQSSLVNYLSDIPQKLIAFFILTAMIDTQIRTMEFNMSFIKYIIVYVLFCYAALSQAANVVDSSNTGLFLDWLEPNVKPRLNFYQFANGGWQKTHPLPNDYARWGSFQVLQEKNQQIIRHILENAANKSNQQEGTNEQKIGDFYFSGMDEATINTVGITPLNPEFDRIANIKNQTDLQQTITHLQMIGVNVPFQFSQMQDYLDSTKVIGVASQCGLGLPDRDYYLKNEGKFVKIRKAYLQHITKMFELLNDAPKKAQAEASVVMRIETTLAKASMSRIDQRDPHAIYHIKNLNQLQSITPHFSWNSYFSDINHPEITSINLAMPDYFKIMDKQLSSVSLEDWKIYLRWHLIHSSAAYLSQPFVDENFNMTSQLTGVKKLLPRWKRVVSAEDIALGFAVGKIYVEQTFSVDDKKAATKMLFYIRQAMKTDLQNLAWMTPATRQSALHKLDLMNERIGYPEVWREYSKLQIDRGPYVLNILRANEFFF